MFLVTHTKCCPSNYRKLQKDCAPVFSYNCCYKKLQKDSTTWHCKNCLKQVLPFDKLFNYQLKALMSGKVLTSPKLLSTNNYLLFPDEESENAAKTELMTPDYFY